MLCNPSPRLHSSSPTDIPIPSTQHSNNQINSKLIRRVLIKTRDQRPFSSTQSNPKTKKEERLTLQTEKLLQYPYNLNGPSQKTDFLSQTVIREQRTENLPTTENCYKTQDSSGFALKLFSPKKMNSTMKNHFERFLKTEQTPKHSYQNLNIEKNRERLFDIEANNYKKTGSLLTASNEAKKINLDYNLSCRLDNNNLVKTNDGEKKKKFEKFDLYDPLQIIQSDLMESCLEKLLYLFFFFSF
jgi:hypothetical protein